MPGLVNAVAQILKFSLIPFCHPLHLGLSCWAGLPLWSQDGPKMVSHADSHMPIQEREKDPRSPGFPLRSNWSEWHHVPTPFFKRLFTSKGSSVTM